MISGALGPDILPAPRRRLSAQRPAHRTVMLALACLLIAAGQAFQGWGQTPAPAAAGEPSPQAGTVPSPGFPPQVSTGTSPFPGALAKAPQPPATHTTAPSGEAPSPDLAAAGIPALPGTSGLGRRVVYSNRAQRVWLVEGDGTVSDSWLVSGRRGVPRPGIYAVFSKSRHTTASGGRVSMEYMTRFARGRTLAIGFHSIPVTRSGRPIQDDEDLGRYRSRGCVRQRPADAARLWDWAPIGTTVVVTP